MITATASPRLIAMAAAIGTTFSIVWSLATLAYPQTVNADAGAQLLERADVHR